MSLSLDLRELLSYKPNWGRLERQKGQKMEDEHAGSWGQVCWVLQWRHTTASLLLLLCFFSLFFKTLLLFYSLKPLSLDLHCPMFPLISNITPKVSDLKLTDTQQQPPAASAIAASSIISASKQPDPPPPSASLLYTVANKEVEAQFSGRGMTL
jgi:hypothetical protein